MWLDEVNVILREYPLLSYTPIENCFSGEIEINTKEGDFVEIFELRIEIPKSFPNSFPLVFETGKNIPRIITRHVMPKTNNLCLAVTLEERLLCRNGITLTWFFEKVLIPRLFEEFRVNNGLNYQKEYSHDFGGIWEFLMCEFKTENTDLIIDFVAMISQKKRPKGKSLCPCNSDQAFSNCHKPSFRTFELFGNSIMVNLHNTLIKYPYKGRNL
jgi:hypothetical protein